MNNVYTCEESSSSLCNADKEVDEEDLLGNAECTIRGLGKHDISMVTCCRKLPPETQKTLKMVFRGCVVLTTVCV